MSQLLSKYFFPANEITTHPALESYSVFVDERQRLHEVPEKDKHPNHHHDFTSINLIITNKSSVGHFIMPVQTNNKMIIIMMTVMMIHCPIIMKPPQSLPLQMAERLLRAQPDSVANHVTDRSIIDRRALT